MFKYGISCSIEPQPATQPTILRGEIGDIARRAKRAGYDAIELFIRDPEQYDPKALNKAAKDNGVAYCAIATGMEYTRNGLCLISDDPVNRRAAIDRLKAHVDLGAEIKAPVIAGIMRGNIPDLSRRANYEARLADALVELTEYAETLGVEIYVESILRYINNYLNSAPETADFLRALGRPNLTLHIDTHSMCLEDANLQDSVLETCDILGYVHFSDSNRCYPGAGNIDFKAVLSALMDVNYQGYISTECQPYPTEDECARRGVQYIKALVQVLEIERMRFKEEG